MQNNKWTEELSRIASIIEKAPLEKSIKWGLEVFTLNGQNVISYCGFKNHFAIWFYKGVFMNDPYKVLVNAQKGKTKSLRQWRFSAMEEIDEGKILEYIQEAIEVEKKGLKIKAEKFEPAVMPKLLEEELKKNEALKLAFGQLTPGKQKEYAVYINEAKQEQTKQRRLEKIKPLILLGVGLNDKYK